MLLITRLKNIPKHFVFGLLAWLERSKSVLSWPMVGSVRNFHNFYCPSIMWREEILQGGLLGFTGRLRGKVAAFGRYGTPGWRRQDEIRMHNFVRKKKKKKEIARIRGSKWAVPSYCLDNSLGIGERWYRFPSVILLTNHTKDNTMLSSCYYLAKRIPFLYVCHFLKGNCVDIDMS